MKKKIMVAMSGGVDSAVAGYLLSRENICKGVTLRLFDESDLGDFDARNCGSSDDISDAKAVCDRLGMPHEVLNEKDAFRKCVMDDFAEKYFRGLTPNPCIECNKHIKFSKILSLARQQDYEYISTGHYCSIVYNGNFRRYVIKKAVDDSKDQTYVLYSLSQDVLSHTLFPLGGMTKTEVREIAMEHGFINARKKDSQDICFIKDGNYKNFLTHHTGKVMTPGDFILADGTVVGHHLGTPCYTVGQRKGLGIAYSHPLYVLSKDTEKNTVTVGRQEELFTTRVAVTDVNFMAVSGITSPTKATAKLRYHQKESECLIHPVDENNVILEFSTPQRAVTSGQAAVFYDGEYLLGGGTII